MKRAIADIETDTQALNQVQKLHKRCDDKLWADCFDAVTDLKNAKPIDTTIIPTTAVPMITTTSTTTSNNLKKQSRVCIVSSDSLVRATTRLPVHRERTLLLFKLIQAYRLSPAIVAPRSATDSDLLMFHDESFVARLCGVKNNQKSHPSFSRQVNGNEDDDDDEATNGLTHDCSPFEGQEGRKL